MYLSPNHGVFIHGRLRQAKKLVNGKTIVQDTKKDDVIYYHIELEDHCSVISNGILTESYNDVGNRDVFQPKNRLSISKKEQEEKATIGKRINNNFSGVLSSHR